MTGRIPPLNPSDWSDDVRALLTSTVAPVSTLEGRATAGADEPRPLNILTVLAHQPELLGPFLAWASALALRGVLSRRDHELLALRTAVNCGSDFEWGHHVVYGRAAGLDDDDLNRIVAGPDAPGWAPDDAALLRATDELHHGSTITEDTWTGLAARYEPAALVELLLVVGQYTMLSMLARAAGVELEDDLAPIPAREARRPS